MPSTTLIPNGGTSFANLTDASDATYIQMNGVSFAASYDLSDCPGDLATVTGVAINLRMAQKVNGTVDNFESVQIFESDGTTALTSAATGVTLTGTITDYTLFPATIYSTDKATWDGAIITITKNADNEGGPDKGIRIYECSVTVNYSDGAVTRHSGMFLLLS